MPIKNGKILINFNSFDIDEFYYSYYTQIISIINHFIVEYLYINTIRIYNKKINLIVS